MTTAKGGPQIPALVGSINPAEDALGILARQINAEHDSCARRVREGIEHATGAGRLLLQAKGQVQHGEWAGWVASNCGFSLRTAQGYMRIARHAEDLEGKSATAAPLTLRGALELLAEPRDPPAETAPAPGEDRGAMTLEEAEATIEKGAAHALEAGRKLIQLRDLIGPERFAKWLDEHEPQARRILVTTMEAATGGDPDPRSVLAAWSAAGLFDDLFALD